MSSETNSIEEKKSSTKENTENWSSFMYGVSSAITYIIIFIWILGSCLLYTTKISRSNIIPTDFVNLQTINSVNANYVREFSITTEKPYINIGKYTAQELYFLRDTPTYIEFFLNYLKSFNTEITIHIHELFKNFFIINNSVVKNIYNLLYGLNESLLMLFSPIIYFFIFIFYSTFYFWGLSFFQIYNFTKLIMFPVDGKTYFWSSIHPFLNFLLFPFYLFLIIFCSFGISFITSIFSIPYTLFGLLGYKYNLAGDTNNSEGDKPTHGFFDFLTSFFKYKISFVMILISLSVLSNTNLFLNNIYIAGSVVAIIILALMGIYNYVYDPTDTTQITKIIKKFKTTS
jgi:hypothetical protein